jgi:hypothetical protein
MNSIAKLFNWVAQHCNKDALFPKEWVLQESEKNHLKSIGYKVTDLQKPIVAPHYAMPPAGTYTVQHITKASGDKLSKNDVSTIEDILTNLRDNNGVPSAPSRKPE